MLGRRNPPTSAEARSRVIGLLRSLILVVVGAIGCGGSDQVLRDELLGRAESRSFDEPSDFLSDYWAQRPLPLQGNPPEAWSELETSLAPATCGTCHAQQYRDWQTTLHSGAFSPGLSGQLVNNEENNYGFVRSCLACHTPLAEQNAKLPNEDGQFVENPFFERSVQEQGLVCAACHVRGWQRHGPPRRESGALDASPPGSPHGGVKRATFFEDSRFCSGCHQFAAPAPNGKSLQNTYEEWKASRYAEAGTSCQSCHMPDRRHLWRGIHDSTMTSAAVKVEWMPARGNVYRLRVTNVGVGHRFPTYVTPEVVVQIDLLGDDRQTIDGAGAAVTIGRSVRVQGGQWIEVSDTRLSPDSSLVVNVDISGIGARFARGTVTVFPDRFYRGVFEGMLRARLSDTSRALIREAHRRSLESPYVIFDDTRALP